MSLSSTAAQQRETEAKSLKTFLGLSLIGSLALHVGVLSAGIGNFWARVPEQEEEPMEVVVVDPPKVEVVTQEKPQQQQQQLSTAPVGTGGSSKLGGYSDGGSGGVEVVRTPTRSIAARNQTEPTRRITPSQSAAVTQKPVPVAPKPTQPSIENLKQEPTKAAPNQQLKSTLGEIRTARENQASAPNSTTSSTQTSPTVNRTGLTVGAASRGTGFGTTTGTSSGSGTGTGRGSGNGFGSGSGTGRGTGSGSTQGTPQGQGRGSGDAEGSGSGRLACRNCSKPKYPERARKRGVEGAAKVAVDVDDKGNVTNVRVTQSSGDAELDEAAARAARRWKFDTPNGARQGVVAKVDFALEGSQRHRQVQEREKRRKVRRKRQAVTAAETRTPVTTNTVPRRNAASAPRRQRIQSQSPNRTQQAAPASQSKLRQTLSRQRQSPAKSSQSKLRSSLRQSLQSGSSNE